MSGWRACRDSNPKPSDLVFTLVSRSRCYRCGQPVIEDGAEVCMECAFPDDAVVIDMAAYRTAVAS